MSQADSDPWAAWKASLRGSGTDGYQRTSSPGARVGNRRAGNERGHYGDGGRLSKEDIDALLSTLGSRTFVALDFETTGLSPDRDRIIEIGAIKFRMAEKAGVWDFITEETYETLIHPGRSIPPEVSAIHGISDLDVSQAPDFKTEAARFLPFLTDTLLVAHNAPFDLGFLLAETRRAGLPEPPNPAYDTRDLARTVVPGLPSYALGKLAKSFGIEQKEAHRGADDARVCMELFGKCIHILAGKHS